LVRLKTLPRTSGLQSFRLSPITKVW